MKSEESARGEGRSIILFIRVLTYDYDTQIKFTSGGPARDARDTRFLPSEEGHGNISVIYRFIIKCHW